MRVLHVISAYYPATYWGGPIFSTHALCNGIARHREIDLRVLTTDTAGPRISDRVATNCFPETYLPGYKVFFTRRYIGRDISPGLLMRLIPMVRWADVVHLTGNYNVLCLPTMMVCRLARRPLVWSPRGTLQATEEWGGARRRSAKGLFDRGVRICVPPHTVMHLTAEMERAPSQTRVPGPSTIVIPNGVEVPTQLPERVWRPGGGLRLMFISRLDPKKGLENLLEAMAKLPATTTLDVYGTGTYDYVASLKALTKTLGLGARVVYHGHVNGAAKTSAFAGADLFVLPSFSENFGMVVAEALAHGVPVITSRSTPWEMIERIGCGRWIDNAPSAVAAAIHDVAGRDLSSMGLKGRAFIEKEFGWQALSDRMVDVYRDLVECRAAATATKN